MILTVTPNPALDVTYELDRVRLGETNRVRAVAESAGGKGVNVARVLAQLGHRVTCAGFLGGTAGERLEDLLGEEVRQAWTLVGAETRRTVTLVDAHGATVLNEPGPPVGARDWERLARVVAAETGPGDVVAVSGSTPPGTSADDLPGLVAVVVAAGARIVVDTSGPGLLAAASAGAHVLKPNEEELLAATGSTDVVGAARDLIARGAGAVVVSRGEDGVLLVGPDATWRARPSAVLEGNPTGAGDAAVAALTAALAEVAGTDALAEHLAHHLPDVVALSGAAVLVPTAGAVDVEAYRRMRALIRTEQLECH